jgi:hypothetical protein
MSEHPHTIDNGGGARLTFVGVRRDDRGDYLEIRNSGAPGAGPPMHVHHLQEEGLTVERGMMGYQVLGEEERRAGPGRNGGKRPGVFDGAYLPRRHRDEFQMLEIPRPVQRFLVPVIVAIGRALGWHRRFAGAPEPVRRP